MQPLTDEERQARRDGWGIYRYTPTRPTREKPFINDQWAFHQSLAKIRVIIGPNRAGKTTPAVAEPAALLLNEDYPEWWGWAPNCTPKSPLTIWMSSPKLPDSIIGDARLKRMFKGFWLTDTKTGERTWTPPMIPPSHLKDPDHLDRVNIRTLETVNGDAIIVKSSKQAPSASAGEEPDLIVVDEPTEPGIWYEYVARVAQRRDARIIHILTDNAENSQTDYLDWLRKDHKGNVEFFRFSHENPHIDDSHHEDVLSLLPPEQKRIRRHGDTTIEARRCYPFANRWHEDNDVRKPEILNPYGGHGNWIPRSKIFPIPKHWTRYIVHDPGITNPGACGWIGVEPGVENCYVYRGLYWQEPHPAFIDTVREIFEATGPEKIRAALIDPKAMKQRMQFGFSAPRERTKIALYNSVSSKLLGRPFRWALAPPSIELMTRPSRIAYLTAMLDPRNTSVPMMWFFDDGSEGMNSLKNEFDKYHWAATPKGRADNPDKPVKKHDHFIWAVEVCAAMGFHWYPDEGDDFSVMPTPFNPNDPDGKLKEFMEGDKAQDFGKATYW